MNTRTTFWQHLLKSRSTAKRSGPIAVLGACVLLGAGTPVVWAVDTQSEEKYPDTALILDASGSMWAPDASGQVRMDAAKEATKKLVEQLPEEQKLALLTYGIGTGNTDAEKEAGCQDVHTLVKLGGARDEIASQIDGLVASGYTPIGPALLAAEKELDGSGKREIVLVSDGIDTCAPPQVADVAREIRERSGDDIVINVVGFNVNDEARTQLQEVASVGGGVYADASDADSLLETLTAKTTDGAKDGDAMDKDSSKTSESKTSESKSSESSTSESESSTTESTSASGEPATPESAENGAAMALGGLDSGDKPAPEVYKSTIPSVVQENGQVADQELKWTVDLEEGQQLNAGFLVPAPEENTVAGGNSITLTPTLTNADGKTCVATATEAKVENDFSFTQSASLLSPVIKKNSVCEPGKYTLSLKRSGELVGDQDLPVNVSLWGVPQVKDGKLAEASDKPDVQEVTVGDASGKLPTDTDMAAAPSVKEGTYDVELNPGETHWFKVPVEDGQRLQMQMEADPVGADGHNLGWKVFGPLYNPIELHVGDKGNVALNANEATKAGIATQPIRWANLKEEGPAANGFLAGEQLVALRHTAPEGQTTPAKFRLALANTGKSEQAPDFSKATGVAENGTDTAAKRTNSNSANVWWLLLLLFTLVGIVSYVAARKKWDSDAA